MVTPLGLSGDSVGDRAPRQRPIDLVHLARQTLGDWGLECEILRIYEGVQRTYFLRLLESSSDGERRANLSSLKGAAMGIGAFALVAQAEIAWLELEAREALDDETIADLSFAVEEVSAYISTLLAE